MYIGYKQIKTKDGGSVRDFYYNDDEQITVESLTMKARKLFFPEGVSKYGAIEDMYATQNDPRPQMIPKLDLSTTRNDSRPEMIPKFFHTRPEMIPEELSESTGMTFNSRRC